MRSTSAGRLDLAAELGSRGREPGLEAACHAARDHDLEHRSIGAVIDPQELHADYIGLWLDVLREDDRAIIAPPARPAKLRTGCSASYATRNLPPTRATPLTCGGRPDPLAPYLSKWLFASNAHGTANMPVARVSIARAGIERDILLDGALRSNYL